MESQKRNELKSNQKMMDVTGTTNMTLTTHLQFSKHHEICSTE